MWKRLWGVTLLLVLASNLCWAQYRFNGTFYQLRWGQTEGSEDLITPVNALGNPLCVKMGTGWSAYLDGVGNLLGWKVSYARLRSLVDGTVYFTVNDPGVGNLKPPGQPYPLPDLPAHVDHAQLEISYVMYYWGAWGPTYYLTPIYSSEVFIVLDAPKATMNPAWVSVLRYSCRWAARASSSAQATDLVTQKLWQGGFYDPGGTLPNTRFYTQSVNDSEEIFYLRSFFEDDYCPRGQCSDFADFLVCLVTSLGAYEMKAQRTYSFNAAYWGWDDPDGGGWCLVTNMVDPAGFSPTSYTFTYHQFAVVGDPRVWEGSFAFVQGSDTVLALGWDRDTLYRPWLVAGYEEYRNHPLVRTIPCDHRDNPWRPTPPNGLTLILSTAQP